MPRNLDIRTQDFEQNFADLLNDKRKNSPNVISTVVDILDTVKRFGDEALINFTKRFDHLDLTVSKLAINQDEITAALETCSEETLTALYLSARRIEDFHIRQKPTDLQYTDITGVHLGYRWTPIETVGIYVPGGTASYPSSVLMTAIPAKIAGVDRLVMVVPSPNGKINPLVLAAARIAKIDEIYRVGGAQAIAALAYGTKTIRPVNKIVGPGNVFVAEAKRQVFGVVDIDMIAGPSEILIVADKQNNPEWIAIDLLSQAEHDTSAQSILITDDSELASSVAIAVENYLATLQRATIARESWKHYGAIILVNHLDMAPNLINRIAPEHLELMVKDPDYLANKVKNAGAIFLGRYTPEAIGDYVGGPSHVLPTANCSRFSSGLGVLDFMKRTSLLRCDINSIKHIGPAAITLAKNEGLEAHGLSVALRINA
ncbi:MAG: histidinol dehydrogenase [Rhodospirillaceae bacterium]|jgi:histidinol dehydrogenase|nr:histidinol dehydrogenase [Rhodospirillaceae bacterium]